jgi:hypothetical protein
LAGAWAKKSWLRVCVATLVFRQGTACLPQAGFSRAVTEAKSTRL